MAVFQSVREKNGAINGLGCFVQALTQQLITIDLENEYTITGTVLEVDGLMNISLGEAQVIDSDGYCQHYKTLYVKGRIIRYIHIPKELSIRETISKYLRSTMKVHRVEQNTAQSRFRQNKLQRYQEETKALVATIKNSQTHSGLNV